MFLSFGYFVYNYWVIGDNWFIGEFMEIICKMLLKLLLFEFFWVFKGGSFLREFMKWLFWVVFIIVVVN